MQENRSKAKIVILHNIISPYKTLLFNELFKVINDFKVLYMAETEANRDWNIRKDELNFPYEFISNGKLQNHNQYKIAVQTWKRLNRINPDILILGGYKYPAYWTALLWAKKNRKKIIIWSASNQTDHKRNFLKEKLKSTLIKKCSAANVYGSRSKDYLIELGLKKEAIFIMGNTTDNLFYYDRTNDFRTKRNKLQKEYGFPARNFLFIGRFSREKNIINLSKAYKKLTNQDNWGLILAGDGPQKDDIYNYIKEHNLSNVFLVDFQQKEDLPKFLAVSDILILPSISEPWGLVVNEAMAAGLPVLVSKKCGCYPDLIKEGVNGFSFDPLDDNELFNLMNNVIHDKYDLKRMGQVSLNIIEDYTPERAAKVVLKTIDFVNKNENTSYCCRP